MIFFPIIKTLKNLYDNILSENLEINTKLLEKYEGCDWKQYISYKNNLLFNQFIKKIKIIIKTLYFIV